MEITNINKDIENLEEITEKLSRIVSHGGMYECRKLIQFFDEVSGTKGLTISFELLENVEIIHSIPGHYEKINTRILATIYRSGLNGIPRIRVHTFNPTYDICELIP